MKNYHELLDRLLDSGIAFSLTAQMISNKKGLFIVKAEFRESVCTFGKVITSMASSDDIATAENLAYERVLTILFAGKKEEAEGIAKENDLRPNPVTVNIKEPVINGTESIKMLQETMDKLTDGLQRTTQAAQQIKITPPGFSIGATAQPKELTELDTIRCK